MAGMAAIGRPKTPFVLTGEERTVLERWSRRGRTARSLALRSKIVLAWRGSTVTPSLVRWASLVVSAGTLMAVSCVTTAVQPSASPRSTSNSPAAISSALPSSSGALMSSADLVAVARKVMSPTGTLCDTLRDTAASDVNACPFTDRLKAAINARYQQAWTSHANPNPVLSSGPPCGPRGSVVQYVPVPTASGGYVSLVIGCGPGTGTSRWWQTLVIVSSNGTLLVDDILIDRSHTGKFSSIYYQ